MASINPPAVNPGDDTEANWANKVVTHVVDTFATVAGRDQQIPSPDQGRVVYLESSKQLQMWNGTAWVPAGDGVYLPLAGGTMHGPISFVSAADFKAGVYNFKNQAGVNLLQMDNHGNMSLKGRFEVTGNLDIHGGTLLRHVVTMPIVAQSTGGVPATPNLWIDSGTGAVWKTGASALRYKEHIDYDQDALADVVLRPVEYQYKEFPEYRYLGFVADDLDDQNPLLATHVDGKVEALEIPAILAVLAAKVSRLEAGSA